MLLNMRTSKSQKYSCELFFTTQPIKPRRALKKIRGKERFPNVLVCFRRYGQIVTIRYNARTWLFYRLILRKRDRRTQPRFVCRLKLVNYLTSVLKWFQLADISGWEDTTKPSIFCLFGLGRMNVLSGPFPSLLISRDLHRIRFVLHITIFLVQDQASSNPAMVSPMSPTAPVCKYTMLKQYGYCFWLPRYRSLNKMLSERKLCVVL